MVQVIIDKSKYVRGIDNVVEVVDANKRDTRAKRIRDMLGVKGNEPVPRDRKT